MKKQLTTLAIGSALLLLTFGCTKDAANKPAANTVDLSSKNLKGSFASLGQGNFNLWGTCNGHPYNITGTNGICVPLGNCATDIDAAQQSSGQSATGMQFNGCFKGGTAANSGAREEAVFLADNVSQWNGNEMGFVKTLENNTLKAYLQGGGQYVVSVISTGDNGYHTFKCQARSTNVHMVDFYVDGAYKCTITNNSGSYYGNYFYFVGTNHWYGGGSNTGQQIEMYNMVTY